jgi:hypothetical protein
MKIEVDSVVEILDGRKGKIVGKLESGEFILASSKGGQITYFKENDVIKVIK